MSADIMTANRQEICPVCCHLFRLSRLLRLMLLALSPVLGFWTRSSRLWILRLRTDLHCPGPPRP